MTFCVQAVFATASESLPEVVAVAKHFQVPFRRVWKIPKNISCWACKAAADKYNVSIGKQVTNSNAIEYGDFMTTSIIDKSFDKFAPEVPMPSECYENADHAMMNFKRSVREAKRLLEAMYSGGAIEVHGVSLPMGKLGRARVFGIVWPEVLKQLTYWEHHARRYVEIPKHLDKDLQSVRLQIDEAIHRI